MEAYDAQEISGHGVKVKIDVLLKRYFLYTVEEQNRQDGIWCERCDQRKQAGVSKL